MSGSIKAYESACSHSFYCDMEKNNGVRLGRDGGVQTHLISKQRSKLNCNEVLSGNCLSACSYPRGDQIAASCSNLETGLVLVFSLLTPQQVQRFVSFEKATHLLLSMNYRLMEDSFQTAS